tara:strand:- start:6 stop:248 length:243 start_codon:yes stop_codon:yes gene_type:complete
MENKKWSREEAEENKNKILEELKGLPTSENNLEWVTKELNQLIDEEESRQEMILIPKNLITNTPNDSELGEKVRAYYNKL